MSREEGDAPETASRIRSRLTGWLVGDRFWQVVVVVVAVCLVAVTFGPALLGRGVFLDVSAMRRYWPFVAFGPTTDPSLWCRSDTWDSLIPATTRVVEAGRSGQWMTWTPYEVGGAPLASTPNHAVLSPLSWPFWVLPVWLAPAFVKLTELVVVMLGMAGFLGRLGVRRSVALLAGLVFFTSGFMVMWTNWPQVRVAALIPALLWALDRAVVERRARDVCLVALVVAGMVFGGFPAVTLYALTTAAVYVLVRGLQQGGVRATISGWSCSGAGVLLGVALTGVQLVPFVASLDVVLAGRETTGPLPLSALLTSAAPDAYGLCINGETWGVKNPIEGSAYVGVGALVLVLSLALVRARRPRPPMLTVLIALLVVWTGLIWFGGAPLELLQSLPGFDSNRIGRASSVFGFLVAAVVGLALERLVSSTGGASKALPRSRGQWIVSFVLVAVAVVTAVLVVEAATTHAAEQGRSTDLVEVLVTPGILLAVSVGALLSWFLLRGRWKYVGVLLLVFVVVVQALMFTNKAWLISPRDDFYPETPAHRFLKNHVGADRYGAGLSWGRASISEMYELRTPVGHEFTLPEWKDLIRAVEPEAQVTLTFSEFRQKATSEVGEDRVLDQLSTRYWAAPPSQVPGARRPARPSRSGEVVPLEPDQRLRCTVPLGGLDGIEVMTGARTQGLEKSRPRIHVRVEVEGEAVTGERMLNRDLPPGEHLRVAVVGRKLATDAPIQVEIWSTGTHQSIPLVGSDGVPACAAITPNEEDGLELVHADAGSVIFERANALSRIRWAGRSEVVSDPAERVDRLVAGIPDDLVLLDSDETPAAAGSTAKVDVVRDDAGAIDVDVNASGPGYLVVADSIVTKGWVARIDGREVDLVHGNHAFGALLVDAGHHRIELRYEAPGLGLGAAVSVAAVAVSLVLLLMSWLRARRRSVTRSVDCQLDAGEEQVDQGREATDDQGHGERGGR